LAQETYTCPKHYTWHTRQESKAHHNLAVVYTSVVVIDLRYHITITWLQYIGIVISVQEFTIID